MKWFSSIATALLATAALAAPTPQNYERIITYNLRVSIRSNAFLDGKYLSVRGNKVGVYGGGDGDVALPRVEFYTIPSSSSSSPGGGGVDASGGFVQLHTYPIGTVDAVLGLVGSGGLSTLTEITNPAAVTFPVGTRADWSSWSLVESTTAVPGAGGGAGAGAASVVGAGNRLEYGGGSRTGRWVAFPQKDGEWVVTWLDGTAVVTQNYLPIDIIYERAPDRISLNS